MCVDLGLQSSGPNSGPGFSLCSGQIRLTVGFFGLDLYLMARVHLPDVSFSRSLWCSFVRALNDLPDSPGYVLFFIFVCDITVVVLLDFVLERELYSEESSILCFGLKNLI